MALVRGQSSAVEAFTDTTVFNQNSLSHNNANQDTETYASSCHQSNTCLDLQNQLNDITPRRDHVLSSSLKDQNHVEIVPTLPGSDFGHPTFSGDKVLHISDSRTSREGPDPSAGFAIDNTNWEIDTETRFSVASSSNNVDNSSGISSRHQDDYTSGSTSSSRQLSGAGRSCGPEQAYRNTRDNSSVHSGASPSTGLLTPSSNPSHINCHEHPASRVMAGPQADSGSFPHLSSSSLYAERPQGNFYPAMDLRSQQNSMLFRSLATMNAPLQFGFGPRQSYSPMWLNEFCAGSSTPNVPGLMPVASESRVVPPLPLTVNSNPRVDFTMERGQASDLRNISQQPLQHSLPIGNDGALGVGFHQWPALSWASQPTQPAGRWHIEPEYRPWFLSPWAGGGSGAQNFDPCPHAANGCFWGLPSQMGHGPYFGPLIFQNGHHLRRLQLPQLQAMGAQMDRESGMISEMHQVLHAAHGSAYLQSEAMVVHQNYLDSNMSQDREMVIFQDRDIDMSLDIDNMSYEELLALGEQIGSVRTGLREETIIELLKQRKYDRCASELSADVETCCICREEYVVGEEIGMLNCCHEFHTDCIKQWLVLKNQCPICKTNGLAT